MKFDPLSYPYGSRRSVVYARNGMVCTSSPLASQIGLEVLKSGGTAIDAALAVAMSLPLLEPTSNGLGSDCFALVWTGGKLYGLEGSGVAPRRLSAETVRRAGYDAVPLEGWLPVMVPGAPAAWAELHRRFGTRPLTELAAPAARYAREGFCVPVTASRQWAVDAARYEGCYGENPALFGPWRDYFTKNGAAYGPGELFQNPDYANTLEELAATNCESFYRGALMGRMVAFSEKTGGFLCEGDFADYHPRWVEPLHTVYRGHDVYEMPPNGHGITVLMALNILEGLALSGDRESADTYHTLIEATKLAFADARQYVADPRTMRTKVADLLSPAYATQRRELIGTQARLPQAGDPSCGDTVYFCTADGQGNMVSFIQSNYQGFGSGVVVPGTAISLQDRGANFSLDPESDNYLEGGKKAYHTIIPGFLAKDGQPVGPFGVMGGFMQPQGHIQVLVNTLDYGMNPQAALDAPRYQWVGENRIQLERGVPAHVAQTLAGRGHQVEIVNSRLDMGRGQIIWRLPDGTLLGGTEPRADGTVAAW